MARELAAGAATVELTLDDGLATLWINHQARHNALTLAMWRMLAEAAEQLAGDPAVRVVLLRGAGQEAFCAGADINEFAALRGDAAAKRGYASQVNRTLEALLALPQPLLAVIHGYCVGGGCELALCADLRLASNRAFFGVPAARLGIRLTYGDVQRLTQLVGPSAARLILYSGEPRLPASRALAIGLVDEVHPPDELDRRAEQLARQTAANAPSTVRWAKQAVAEVLRDPTLAGLPEWERSAPDLFGGADFEEGVSAFLERRGPRFQPGPAAGR